MAEICLRVLDGFGMPVEWALSIVVPIFKGIGDIRSCICYRAVKPIELGKKVVERELEKRLCRIVTVDEMQFDFMPERGTIDAVFIIRRLQEEYHGKCKKLYMCFMDLENAIDRVPRKVLEWALRKKGIPVSVTSVMSLYEGARTRIRLHSELSKEFEVNVGMHQGSDLSPFLLALVVDVINEFIREGALSELLCADDLVLVSETFQRLRDKFLKWKEAFERKGLKVNLVITTVMVSSDIT